MTVPENTNNSRPAFLPFVKLWLVGAAFLSCAGVVLSLIRRFTPAGYAAALAFGLVLLWVFGRRLLPTSWGIPMGKLRWRLRHLFPAFFVLVALLATTGAILYAPNNYDALTYRIPRMLHWFAEHRWNWIDTTNGRMNFSGIGFGWLAAPLLALTHSDRLLFLVNVLFYPLLPGLIYATFVRFGVSKRMAWYWMWLLPCGYCFALQAGSIVNDSLGVFYMLASVCFALRFKETARTSDLWFSIIAAALLTCVKVSMLPLMLPIAVALFPSVRHLPKVKLIPATLVIILAFCISFLPIAWKNFEHTGTWTGEPGNDNHLKIENPVLGIIGNTIQVTTRNFMPPVMPAAKLWNDAMGRLQKTRPFTPLIREFPRFNLSWVELEQEESAGMGFGISVLLTATLFWLVIRPFTNPPKIRMQPQAKEGMLICLSGMMALVVLMAKVGSSTAARVITPYYPLLIASLFLLPGGGLLARKRWWKRLAFIALISALPVVVLTPARPLWPALTVFDKLNQKFPGNPLIFRGKNVYQIYRDRADCLAPLVKYLSPKDTVVGFLGWDDPETSLWRPFGSRRIVNVTPSNQAMLTKQTLTVFVRGESVPAEFGQTFQEWNTKMHGRIIGRENIQTKASRGPRELGDWYVVRLEGSGKNHGLQNPISSLPRHSTELGN